MFRQVDGEANQVGFDLAMIMSLGFLLIILVLLMHLADKKPSERSVQQGNVIVETYWDDSVDTDVDLWLLAPGDVPVGYSRPGGLIFNLLRDDRGRGTHDQSGKNMEIATTRGVPDGEYVINLHLYGLGDGPIPLDVRVVVSVKGTTHGGLSRQMFVIDTKLDRECQEKTVIRFMMQGGQPVRGSEHHVEKKLRSRQSCGIQDMDQ